MDEAWITDQCEIQKKKMGILLVFIFYYSLILLLMVTFVVSETAGTAIVFDIFN